MYDSADAGHHQWATSQPHGTSGNLVQAVKSIVPFGGTWYSTNSNFTYPLNWNVALEDGTLLTSSSVLGDQEIGPPTTLLTYEGSVNVTGIGPNGECMGASDWLRLGP